MSQRTYQLSTPLQNRIRILDAPAREKVKQQKKVRSIPLVFKAFFMSINWVKQILVSAIIISLLLFIVVNFYIFASVVNLTSFIYVFLLLSFFTDGIFILFQIFRKKVTHPSYSFNPKSLTIVIACYNGGDVIGETLRQAKKHVPPSQIIVVSDASTDDTVARAKVQGVRVIENKQNLSKVFSINRAMSQVHTPYVLVMDDDVLIGDTTIPTGLLDQGYTAVAFNVMPVETNKLLNRLQVFEYRSSMQIGKNLRGKVGAIGNVSGAIGLYHTRDLKKQITLHSGQFAGEDEQRTLLAQLHGKGKGITYTDQVVTTHAPSTVRSLFKQRAYSWSLAVPELFLLYWRILLSPKHHFLLKAEKAYSLYMYLTDPLRLLFIWALVWRPENLLIVFLFYFVLNALVWLRTGAKDSFIVIMLYPLYKLWLTICRFIGNFYWFKVKATYLRSKWHKNVTRRHLIPEYAFVMLLFAGLWVISATHFFRDVKLYAQIQSTRLEEPIKPFNYDTSTEQNLNPNQPLDLVFTTTPPDPGSYVAVGIEKGDTSRAVAHKAVQEIIESRLDIGDIPYESRKVIDAKVLESLQESGVYMTNTGLLLVDAKLIENAIGIQPNQM